MNKRVKFFLIEFFRYKSKDIKDTELGKLRILEKDVKDKAISKAVFLKGKTMASKGNFYYRFVLLVLY